MAEENKEFKQEQTQAGENETAAEETVARAEAEPTVEAGSMAEVEPTTEAEATAESGTTAEEESASESASGHHHHHHHHHRSSDSGSSHHHHHHSSDSGSSSSSGSSSHHHHHEHHHGKTLKPWQKYVLAAAGILVVAGLAFTGNAYQKRKAEKQELEAWKTAQSEAAASSEAEARALESSAAALAGSSAADFDYATISDNVYDIEHCLNRLQLFRQKELTYNGKHYIRNSAVKAVLFMGLDRTADDLQKIRPEHWEQGQTDGLLVMAWNKSSGKVKFLEIPRDTMALMTETDNDDKVIGESIDHICMAYGYGDGVTRSCDYTLNSVSGLLGGLKMQQYMLGDINIISTLADLVGGVTVTVPDDGLTNLDPDFVKGATITVRGKQAERFCRSRDTSQPCTQFERVNRQRVFIVSFVNAVIGKLKTDKNFLSKLFDTVEQSILTDMDRNTYLTMAAEVLSAGTIADGNFTRLPGEIDPNHEYEEYHPYYADINEVVLDMFYREKQ